VDKIINVSTNDSKEMSKRLTKEYGLFVGISAAANVLGSLKYSQETGKEDIITILCDRGERYLSCL
jgi:cysteine synthase